MVKTSKKKDIEDAQQVIDRNTQIVNGLENYAPFQMLVEDFKKNLEIADGNWHLINIGQTDKFLELKTVKIAALTLINVVDSYKHDIDRAKERIDIAKGKVQGSYYDE